ncbi:MAG: 8-amino-7-oxononanoate synthase, partial [Actinomycetota bacterium]|nr:8-amino-7-oxononanoate synthase [Actinomycetota bacterium]
GAAGSASDPAAVDLAGNDYLGLSRHPAVVAGAGEALRAWGAGATGSRLVTGNTALHEELEQALADHCGQPSALVFSSGYLANLGVVTALAGADCLVVSDAHNHASLIDACRLSRSRVVVTPHADVDAVRDALAGRSEPRALVLTESVFSVLGDLAPLPELADLCAAADAVLVVDEAHGLGVAGQGRGAVAECGLAGRTSVVVTATLSKALGAQGGVVLGSSAVRNHLINTARPFIYDTGLAPAIAGAALAALSVLRDEPERVARVRRAAAALAAAAGVATAPGAVLSRTLAGPAEALAAAEECARHGIRVGCFRPPSTPDGSSRLRLTGSAALDDAALDRACEVLRRVLA